VSVAPTLPTAQALPPAASSSQAGAAAAAKPASSAKPADAFSTEPRSSRAVAPAPQGEPLRGGLDIAGLFGRQPVPGHARKGDDSTGQIGWMQKAGLPPTRDITSDFKSSYAQQQDGQNVLPQDANKYVYLTVYGLTGMHWPGYMEANREALSGRGLDVREIKVDTEAPTRTNAEQIARTIKAVEAEGKQVVLIGHSKGGLDATAALSLHPELAKDVRAVVTMQTPYGGAPLAQDLESNIAGRLGVDFLASDVFGGDPKSVQDLTYTSRQDFIRKHPFPTNIPVVSLATSDTSQLSPLAGPNDYTRLRYGEKTDGLVSPKDAFVPGANVVTLNDLDHVNSTLPNPLSHWDPGDLTVSLVAMALKYPPATQAAAA